MLEAILCGAAAALLLYFYWKYLPQVVLISIAILLSPIGTVKLLVVALFRTLVVTVHLCRYIRTHVWLFVTDLAMRPYRSIPPITGARAERLASDDARLYKKANAKAKVKAAATTVDLLVSVSKFVASIHDMMMLWYTLCFWWIPDPWRPLAPRAPFTSVLEEVIAKARINSLAMRLCRDIGVDRIPPKAPTGSSKKRPIPEGIMPMALVFSVEHLPKPFPPRPGTMTWGEVLGLETSPDGHWVWVDDKPVLLAEVVLDFLAQNPTVRDSYCEWAKAKLDLRPEQGGIQHGMQKVMATMFYAYAEAGYGLRRGNLNDTDQPQG